jgi:ABC-type Na+ efflux pump permease subunit
MMRKLWVLAFKELKVTLRDVGALVSMLLSPLLLTLAIGAAFGTGGSAVLSDIPVLVLDRDGGSFSEELRTVFDKQSEDGLLLVTYVSDEAAARDQVERDEAAALVIIPSGMSQSILPIAGLAQDQLGLDVFEMSPEDVQGLTPEQQLQFG